MARVSKTRLFEREADAVARALIGKTIERYVADSDHPINARIIAAGAYEGLTGNRKEQEGMHSPPGIIYLMPQRGNLSLNFGTESAEAASVVSILGLEQRTGTGTEYIVGPGRVTKFLQIDTRFDGMSLDDLFDLVIKGRSARSMIERAEDGQRIGTGSGAGYVHYSGNCTAIYVYGGAIIRKEHGDR